MHRVENPPPEIAREHSRIPSHICSFCCGTTITSWIASPARQRADPRRARRVARGARRRFAPATDRGHRIRRLARSGPATWARSSRCRPLRSGHEHLRFARRSREASAGSAQPSRPVALGQAHPRAWTFGGPVYTSSQRVTVSAMRPGVASERILDLIASPMQRNNGATALVVERNVDLA